LKIRDFYSAAKLLIGGKKSSFILLEFYRGGYGIKNSQPGKKYTKATLLIFNVKTT
jgi:hypothetical protein